MAGSATRIEVMSQVSGLLPEAPSLIHANLLYSAAHKARRSAQALQVECCLCLRQSVSHLLLIPTRGLRKMCKRVSSVVAGMLTLGTQWLIPNWRNAGRQVRMKNSAQLSQMKPANQEFQDLYVGLVRLHVLHHASIEPIFGLGIISELGRHGCDD